VSKWFRAVFCLVFLSVLPVGALAQLSTATMFGTVTDPSGAAVPNAKVTLTQTDTQFVRAFTTRADGSYREEFLPVGPYKMTIEDPGAFWHRPLRHAGGGTHRGP